jgi:hypothetical protein
LPAELLELFVLPELFVLAEPPTSEKSAPGLSLFIVIAAPL